MILLSFQTNRDVLPDVKVGDVVIAKHKNCRYYHCNVVDTRTEIFYEVDFDDGSFSKNMFPEDIEVIKNIF